MGLPHFTIDLRDEFRAGVVEPFIAGYAEGETPNPCVGCNGHVRLDAMLELADRLGCATLATGHYARTAEPDHDRGPLLRVAADAGQGSDLHARGAVAPARWRGCGSPSASWTKPEVRRIAADAGLPVASKADSQDLCFLAGTDRGRFLERHGELGDRVGPIVDRAGAVLGRHRGQHRFTVGQRRGLGYAGGEPLFVLEKDAGSNTIVVGPREALRSCEVRLRASAAAPRGRARGPGQASLSLHADPGPDPRGTRATRGR